MCLNCIHLLFQISFYFYGCNAMPMEPSCSSFEFEKKMLENTVRMEYEYKLSNKKVSDELTYLNDEKKKMITEITETHQRQTAEISEQIKTMDTIFKNQQATMQRLTHDLHEMKNETMKEIIDKSRPAYISFRASVSSHISLSPGTTIVFQNVSVNHGNGYDPSTGHFTAPVNGTYMFIARVCPTYQNNVVINIVVDENVYTRGLHNDNYQHNCFSYSDVIDLVQGMRVWINCGTGSASSISLQMSAPYYQNVFAGYIL